MGTANDATSMLPAAPSTAPSPTEIQQIADEAIAHVRTVERRLLGIHVRGRVGERVDEALARRGYLHRGL